MHQSLIIILVLFLQRVTLNLMLEITKEAKETLCSPTAQCKKG
jgi:hypothetical protein